MKTFTTSLMGIMLLALNLSIMSAQAAQTERGQDGERAERSLSQRLLACRDIDSAVARLDCFDQVANAVDDTAASERRGRGEGAREAAQARVAANRERADVRQEEALQRAAEARDAAEARGQQARGDNFGREHRRDSSAGDDNDVRYVNITEAWQNPRGLWRFRLEDGSEWHQVQSERFQFDENANYYIERGILSSFRLGWDGSNRNIRVRRVD